MGIASVLMVGLSTFFASTFHNLFQAQAENVSTERQYAVNQIMADKFEKMEQRIVPPSNQTVNFSYSATDGDTLPFTYMSMVDSCPSGSVESVGSCQDKNGGSVPKQKVLAFKDLMPFNKFVKIDADTYAYGDMGTGTDSGEIKNAKDNSILRNIIRYAEGKNEIVVRNFAGFSVDSSGNFFIAVPDRDVILECKKIETMGDWCEKFGDYSTIGGLNMPMDVTFGGGVMYISDSGNNRIIKYPIDPPITDTNPIQKIELGMNFPTGLAYYTAPDSKKYLFVADTFNNKIKKIWFKDTGGITISTVVGDGESQACDGTARLCKLNMPTGLFVDKVLYIADSGNNRILKMSDPGEPNMLKLQFELSNSYTLDRIEFKGDWSGGTYDNAASNLTGSSANYNGLVTPATFSNSDRFTVYSDSKCETGGTFLFVNEDLSLAPYLKAGTYLVINSTGFQVTGDPTRENCTIDTIPPAPATSPREYKWKIPVSVDPGTTSGTVYPSNPNNVIIQINGPITWIKKGYVTTEIKTYDIASGGLAETDYQTTLVGDGILGTEEDEIQVLKDHLNFPTGVSDQYVADSLDYKILDQTNFWNPLATTFNSVNTSFDIGDYDYVSDFPLDSIAFNKYGNILEAVITTLPDPNNASSVSQVYKHDAILKP